MPHASLKLLPGVDVLKTPALNEAAISTCNLIRYALDRSGLGLVQKLGGWLRFFNNAMPSIPRALLAWADTNANNILGVGCDIGPSGSYLGVIIDGNQTTLTPQTRTDNVAVDVTTASGSNVVTITDTGSNVADFDAVFVAAHIAVGGVIIYGLYQCISASANTFQVALYDPLGNPILATSTVANGGDVAVFDTTSGDPEVLVTLAAHGYKVGDTYPVMIETTVGGITLKGNYLVLTVPSADTFTIQGPQQASSTTTASINGGDARYVFYLSSGPLPTGSGYGIGGYGIGGYGTGGMPGPSVGNNIETTDWVLDNWGAIFLALPTSTLTASIDGVTPVGAPIMYWSPESNTANASPIAAGPLASGGMFVAMPQRQIVAYNTTDVVPGPQDPLLVRWCDSNNFTSWVGTPTNLAGKYRIPRGSKIVGGLQVNQQGLLFTDLAVWSMQFIGAGGGENFVYSFNQIGAGCGLIAQKAVATLAGITYWMGQSQFFALSGSGVTPIPCPVWDVIFQNVNKDFLYNIRAAANSNFGEIAWFYPSAASVNGENDSYVKYNTIFPAPQGWDYGTLPLTRSAWIDQSVFGPPIGADPTNNVIYQHELSNDADGQALTATFTTGYFVLADGDVLMFVDQFWPDMRWGQYGSSPNAQLMVTFNVVEYPGQTPDVHGPFTIEQASTYVTPRFRGRLVSLTFQNLDVGTFWRLGLNRYRYQPDGKFL